MAYLFVFLMVLVIGIIITKDSKTHFDCKHCECCKKKREKYNNDEIYYFCTRYQKRLSEIPSSENCIID